MHTVVLSRWQVWGVNNEGGHTNQPHPPCHHHHHHHLQLLSPPLCWQCLSIFFAWLELEMAWWIQQIPFGTLVVSSRPTWWWQTQHRWNTHRGIIRFPILVRNVLMQVYHMRHNLRTIRDGLSGHFRKIHNNIMYCTWMHSFYLEALHCCFYFFRQSFHSRSLYMVTSGLTFNVWLTLCQCL